MPERTALETAEAFLPEISDWYEAQRQPNGDMNTNVMCVGFLVGDSAFHVTMSPSPALMERRCRANLADGFRPIVLVPDDRVAAAEQLAELAGITNRVRVSGIEDFVAGNVEEMAGFTNEGIRAKLRELLSTYNVRVSAAEPDPSLQIEVPDNL